MTLPTPPTPTGAVVGWPRTWLRLEGLAGLVAGVVGYRAAGGDLIWLVPLLLVVDVSMVGYLAGPHPGAIVYNIAHNWFTALAVLGVGLWLPIPAVQLAGWVLIAHVGGDRLAGYGLKYAPAFGDTHLGWIGRRRSS
ncbi:MAG TPA: DUF4260 family protein [Candidatus Limnocylindrales bacterium]|nr:DUF4260 family protein [Candidatus Limnocylindrales bacterium]